MNKKLASTIQLLRSKQRFASMLSTSLIFAGVFLASPLVAGEKIKSNTQVDAQAPEAISKVDIHAADLSTQPNMRSTGVMLDNEGRIHVLCVDPSTPKLESSLQERVQASHHFISEK